MGAIARREAVPFVFATLLSPSAAFSRSEQLTVVPAPQSSRSVRFTNAGPAKKYASVSTKIFWKMASLPRKGVAVICGETSQLIRPSCCLNSLPTFTATRRRSVEPTAVLNVGLLDE